jgi:hypothetical protein
MDLQGSRRTNRGEAVLRALQGFALILAVAWAVAGNGEGTQGIELAGLALH